MAELKLKKYIKDISKSLNLKKKIDPSVSLDTLDEWDLLVHLQL